MDASVVKIANRTDIAPTIATICQPFVLNCVLHNSNNLFNFSYTI